jgi:phosphoglycolate phosphatase
MVLGVETHKSKEVKFGIIFEETGLLKDECVFVTDTLGDILEANKVGVRTIAVTFGYHDEKRLAKGNPSVLVSDFKEISQNL